MQRCWQGGLVAQSRIFLVGDRFFYSRDLNVWSRGDIVRRIKMLVTLKGFRLIFIFTLIWLLLKMKIICCVHHKIAPQRKLLMRLMTRWNSVSFESSLPQSKLPLTKNSVLFTLKKKKKDFIKCLFLALKLGYGVSIAPFLIKWLSYRFCLAGKKLFFLSTPYQSSPQ